MVRPLLIALLTVAAVAWPAAAQGLPDPGLPDLNANEVPPDRIIADADSEVASSCRAVVLAWDESDGPLPDLHLRLDPDGCINQIIDQVWPFWYDLRADSEGDGFLLL